MKLRLGLGLVLAVFLPLGAGELPLVLEKETFDKGIERWFSTDPEKWTVDDIGGNRVLHLHGKSKYNPPVRSPHSIILLKHEVVGDFVLTARVKTLQTTRGHRDMCIFFGWQDPSHFYYVHLGEKPDPNSSQIFIVNDDPRTKITETGDVGVPWKDDTWHDVKVVRRVGDGLIEVYFDDMEKPQKVAHDKTFQWGLIGLGSFDDLGLWDDVEIRGVRVDKKAVLPEPNRKGETRNRKKKVGNAGGSKAGVSEGPVAKMDSPGAIPESGSELIFTKWSGDLNVPDPVAVSLDHEGRAYVTQTQRRKIQDLDIRQFRDWIPDDVGFQTVDDKRNFYHRVLAPGKGDQRIRDLNGDGSHDYLDLMVLSEKIHLLEDRDGDGIADHIQLYADDFRTEVTGVAGGVLWHDGEVFLTAVPDVYRLRDSDGDGAADQREIIATGFGVHIAYAGHDMHGLTVGPDGKIYWSVGDKGISVTTSDGERFHFPNQGGVMRCNPDGSGFEVFAHGLRNVQELAFDEFGNLFGVDNDADRPGEKERFVYIARGMDAGWRCNYQYRGDDYNPWTEEGLWQTQADFPGRPWYTVPPISNYVDGPCGFTYNPGTALGRGWERTFFLTGAPKGTQYAFQVERDGAGFRMVNSRTVGQGIAITGWNFGPDGALYGTDWGVTGYPLTQSGAVWKIDVDSGAGHPLREETAALLKSSFDEAATSELVGWLNHPDQRVRLKAQFELVAREEVDTLAEAAEKGAVHGVWGLGQLNAVDRLVALASNQDPGIRVQAGRVAAGLESFPPDPLHEFAGDPDPRVRFMGLQALAEHGNPESLETILSAIEENGGRDIYLRHAGIMALTRVGESALADLASHSSEAVQRSAVVALRRLGSPSVARFLEGSEAVASEAAMAIHDDFSIEEAFPMLADALGNHRSEPFARRALNANFRLGLASHAGRVAEWAAEGSVPLALRKAAVDLLLKWTNPPEFDQVDGRIRDFSVRDSVEIAAAIGPSVGKLLQEEAPMLQAGGMDLAKKYGIQLDPTILSEVVADESAPDEVRIAALEIISGNGEFLGEALGSGSASLRIRALEILIGSDPEAARKEVGRFAVSDGLRERQAGIRGMANIGAVAELTPFVKRLLTGTLEPGIQLEVIEAAGKLGIDDGLSAFISGRENILDPKRFTECLEGGDVGRGESIFRNHIAAQCIRCHKVEDGAGSIIGPNLKNTAAKGPEYLLEALVAPQKVIAKGYGSISVTLRNGTVVAGQFRGENADSIMVRDLVSKKVTSVKKKEVASRGPVISVMPPMGAVLQRGEIRDLMAYLMTLKE